jgi:hypothetical protein
LPQRNRAVARHWLLLRPDGAETALSGLFHWRISISPQRSTK